MKKYQLFNWQHDPIKVFDTLDETIAHIVELHKTYKEDFYIIELSVAYTTIER